MEMPQCLPGSIWFMVASEFDSAIDLTSKFYDLIKVKVKVRVKSDPRGQA